MTNEVTSLTKILQMIGGSNDYMAAIMVAAFINLFEDTVTYDIEVFDEMFAVSVFKKEVNYPALLMVCLPNKFLEVFREKDKD